MTDRPRDKASPEFLFYNWMKDTTEFWKPIVSMWAGAAKKDAETTTKRDKKQSRMKESFETTRKAWEAMSSIMVEPETIEALFKGTHVLPQILINLAQTSWKGLMHFQQQWMEKAGRIGESSRAYTFENLDEDILKIWNDLYKKEFRKLFNIPQLGLTRFYQEKMLRAMDKYNIYQAAVAEFLHLLYLPVEKSLKTMQLHLTDLANEGDLSDDPKTYYQMWIKILEGHYMTLFQSPEYNQTLSKTLESVSEFSEAKKEVLQDTLNMLPVPTQKEMDELYKEIYILKKKIKALEKKK
jgi:class III poly(R)-hydroxyalkanoic acid synthase PhaE subunit